MVVNKFEFRSVRWPVGDGEPDRLAVGRGEVAVILMTDQRVVVHQDTPLSVDVRA
jgi:hypothetical protein